MLISLYFYLLVYVLVSLFWLRLTVHRPAPAFKRRAVTQSVSAITAVPKNQRKPEWVRSELIRLAALSCGSRRNVARIFNRLHGEH